VRFLTRSYLIVKHCSLIKINIIRISIGEQNVGFLLQYSMCLALTTFGNWQDIKSETITEIYWTKICVISCTSDGTPPCFALQRLARNTGIRTTWRWFWCNDRDSALFVEVLHMSCASGTRRHKQTNKKNTKDTLTWKSKDHCPKKMIQNNSLIQRISYSTKNIQSQPCTTKLNIKTRNQFRLALSKMESYLIYFS
jgi:hypothetical protein